VPAGESDLLFMPLTGLGPDVLMDFPLLITDHVSPAGRRWPWLTAQTRGHVDERLAVLDEFQVQRLQESQRRVKEQHERLKATETSMKATTKKANWVQGGSTFG